MDIGDQDNAPMDMERESEGGSLFENEQIRENIENFANLPSIPNFGILDWESFPIEEDEEDYHKISISKVKRAPAKKATKKLENEIKITTDHNSEITLKNSQWNSNIDLIKDQN